MSIMHIRNTILILLTLLLKLCTSVPLPTGQEQDTASSSAGVTKRVPGQKILKEG